MKEVQMFKKTPNQTNKTTKPLCISLSNSNELKINIQVSFVPRQQIEKKTKQNKSAVLMKKLWFTCHSYTNEEYTLSAIILCIVIQTVGNEAAKADVVVKRTV